MSRRLGVNVMPLEGRREAIVELATRADELGYEAIFLPETWSYDVAVLLAEIAIRTERIELGSSIISVWSRSAASIAMAASTLQALSAGRFVLGLGASSAELTQGLHDRRFDDPAGKLRETILQVRRLLAGEGPVLATEPDARAIKLALQSELPVPIYAAALAPSAVRIAGELCDGWLPFLIPRRELPRHVGMLEERAAARPAGRGRARVCPLVPTVLAASRAEACAGAAWFVAFYLTKMGTIYRRILERWGFAREVAAVLEANRGRRVGVVPESAEALLEELTVFGTADEIAPGLESWRAAGADMPILVLQPGLARLEVERTLLAALA
ncbi:MAG: LLM class flavin-dependent oxidoreductase [Thermodesulfobacteriota bacterium]